MSAGVLIGGLHELGQDYVQAWDSGAFSDSIDDGERTRTVTQVLYCTKEDMFSVSNGLDREPDALRTPAGRQTDGAPANMTDWGGGYTLTDIRCSDVSPQIVRMSVDYEATDPTAGSTAISYLGASGGGWIGGLHERGRIYTETERSGYLSVNRVYLATSFGWNRSREINVEYICRKEDILTIADGIELEPDPLQTVDGTGGLLDWYGYELLSLRGEIQSPSMVRIKGTYRRNIAEAIAAPPAGVDLTCTAGKCRITWNDVLFEEFDSEDGVCKKGIDVILHNGYDFILTCNGVPFNSFTPDNQSGDKSLAWELDGNTARLLAMGERWKEYTTG